MELQAKDVLEIMLDPYSSQIIMGTMEKEMGIREISKKLDIPLSVCYRRVKMLVEKGILKEKKHGKRVKYLSTVDNFKAVLNFDNNEMHVEMSVEEEKVSMKSSIL